ncbi:hypothetical protein [Saccharopolyspora shandongensis]|uniref:hypothetical protein n=1 Tax=Saccharopolyspora shandongensis TaxID=418495 RepID=UPI003400D5FA
MTWELNMRLEATDTEIVQIQSLLSDTSSTWLRLRPVTVNNEEGIGQGRLAQAFRPTYVPAAEQIRTLADDVLDKLAVTTHAGRVAVQAYREAEIAASQTIEGGVPGIR